MTHITGLYAALGALLVMALTARVIWLRHTRKIGLGSGGDEQLARAIRAHANAIEYLPIALLLLLVMDIDGTQAWLLHLFGAVLIVGRALHALGLSAHSGYSFGRFTGIALTLLAIIAMALLLLWRFVAVHALAA